MDGRELRMLQCGRPPPPPEGAETCDADPEGAEEPREKPPPLENSPPPPPPNEERGAGGGTMAREGGAMARAEAKPSGRRAPAALAGLFLPSSARGSLLMAADPFREARRSVPSRTGDEAALALTKRCSSGLYMMEELRLSETIRVPFGPSRMEREVRSGMVLGMRLLSNAREDGDFTVSHFSEPLAVERRGCRMLVAASGEKTPCSRLRGGLPGLSSGLMGTIPSFPSWRTKTAVDAR